MPELQLQHPYQLAPFVAEARTNYEPAAKPIQFGSAPVKKQDYSKLPYYSVPAKTKVFLD